MKQKLVYIAGAGHSGSTLLEMFVSGAPAHVGLGEIFQLVDRRNSRIERVNEELCSCGEIIEQCPYWSPILATLNNIPREDEAARYTALADGFAQRFGPEAVMLDSSKTPEGLAAAIGCGAFDIRVLHLARDVRSWLVSQRKSYARNGVATWRANTARDGIFKGTVRHILRTPLADARRWQKVNRAVEELVATHALPSLPVSYERLCFDTDAMRREIEDFLDVSIAGYGTAAARDDNHSVFGNRMRFDPEKLQEIRYDNGWMRDNSWLLPWTVSPSLRRQNARLQGRGTRA
ncbi:sulfotransferase [Aurantiacibacter poecillastricola]|uniref:sulfotransferase n=1 Tax=Aurantiacibacter poecillastricola TaxID=3064385 RepID=UPI00273DC3AB|nr:sulfotransferase [Aurantiacibacter sp. 219JJ12-13]MDP5261691.1 sulfotransferase [Aurantiacibacter sp. 219JJ12-13]